MTGRPLLPLYWRRGIRPTGLRVILILTPRLPSVRFVDPVLWNSPPCSMTGKVSSAPGIFGSTPSEVPTDLGRRRPQHAVEPGCGERQRQGGDDIRCCRRSAAQRGRAATCLIRTICCQMGASRRRVGYGQTCCPTSEVAPTRVVVRQRVRPGPWCWARHCNTAHRAPKEKQVASVTVPDGDLALLAAALDQPDSDLGAVFKALSVRNQAIGVLIDRGNAPEEARIELYRRASREGVSMNQTAQDILDTLTVLVLPNWAGSPELA
jgi:hypothetical protein